MIFLRISLIIHEITGKKGVYFKDAIPFNGMASNYFY